MDWVGRRELSVLIAVFVILASLWGFAELADEVGDQETRQFDRTILLSMRSEADMSEPIGPGWVQEMGRDFTAMGGIGVLTLTTLAVIGFLLLEGQRRMAAVVLVATAGALIASTLLKQSIDRPRPDLVPHGSITYTASFPSGHSMHAASTYLTLGALLARIQHRRRAKAFIIMVAVFLTLLVGISRVYLGVHWPTDVLAGWAAGSGWALMCWLLARWLQRTRALPEEPELDSED